jgi:hypothetical protein
VRRFSDPNFIPGADDIDGDGDPFAKYETEFGQTEFGQGQVDGDASDSVRWSPGGAGQPWLRSPLPPWHLWGNTQTLIAPVETIGAFRAGSIQQLIKVSYKRPDTFHWLFSARLLSGPDNTATFFTRIFVRFNLTVGIGRSAIQLVSVNTPFAHRAFEEYTFQWGPIGTAFPREAQIYSNQSTAPSRSFQADGPSADGAQLTEIVAQDIQLEAQILALTVAGNVAAVGQPVAVEVSAQFAPQTHVRPDWYQERMPPEVSFAGAEVGGS